MFDTTLIPPALLPFAIFFLRLVDVSLDTIRVLMVIRGRRPAAWVLGFFQSLLFVIAITSVLTHLDNIWNVFAFAAGYATGTTVGITVEKKLAIGHGHMRIISSSRGSAIAEAIRKDGYAATEIAGRGKDGTVTVINSSVRRKDIDSVRNQVREIDPEAFITVEEVRPIHRGFWRA